MPELPEVETVVRGLRERVLGKAVLGVQCHREGTVIDEWGGADISGKVERVDRRGKYILMETDAGFTIMVHLRMTGKLIFMESEKSSNHCRAEIQFSDNIRLLFDDVRTFGKVTLLRTDQVHERLSFLGVEPLSEEFSASYLGQILKKKKSSIKNVLLDQRVVAGLGNIYVAEILYKAGVSPLREAIGISAGESELIVEAAKSILLEAISKNGTTISDYRSVTDKTGEFQNFLRVYGKEKCVCGRKIEKLKQAGRTSYFCSHCQR
jgi:formamidopyrimidine-DNA glycosylase